MSYARKVDANHAEVRDGIRDALPGCTIFDAAGAGDGFPDLVVGWRGMNFLLEVKPKGKKLRGVKQCEFHKNWQGQTAVVHSAAEGLAAMLVAMVDQRPK